MTQKERMYARITAHGENLIRIFDLHGTDPVTLCKKLHSLEVQAHAVIEQYMNGEIDDPELDQYTEKKLIPALTRIIGGCNYAGKVFINHDPRGYALKLTEEATKEALDYGINIHRDWGGYGILAPAFDGKP